MRDASTAYAAGNYLMLFAYKRSLHTHLSALIQLQAGGSSWGKAWSFPWFLHKAPDFYTRLMMERGTDDRQISCNTCQWWRPPCGCRHKNLCTCVCTYVCTCFGSFFGRPCHVSTRVCVFCLLVCTHASILAYTSVLRGDTHVDTLNGW